MKCRQNVWIEIGLLIHILINTYFQNDVAIIITNNYKYTNLIRCNSGKNRTYFKLKLNSTAYKFIQKSKIM